MDTDQWRAHCTSCRVAATGLTTEAKNWWLREHATIVHPHWSPSVAATLIETERV